MPTSHDQALEAASVWERHGKNAAAAARELDIPRSTLQERLKRASMLGLCGYAPVPPGFEVSQISHGPSGTFTKMRPEGPATAPPEGLVLKGASVLSRDGREVVRWDKYAAGPDDNSLATAVRAAFEDYPTTYLTHPVGPTSDETVAVYPVADAHLGLLAWKEETGEDYDITIARDVLTKAFDQLVAATPASGHALILGLGDLAHVDNYENRTDRSGNALDTDSRYPKILRESVRLIRYLIDLALTKHETVEVRLLSGNHDSRTAIAVALALSLGYEKNPRVMVDDSPAYIWFRRYGKVLIGATHGDRAKMADMPLLMAVDRPEDWAASTRRRVFTGHIHHERLREIGGVIVESLRSPVAKDAYHSFEGYRAGRSVYSYTFWTDGSRTAKVEFEI